MTKPLIIYHKNCSDGHCAAWIANGFFGKGKADFHAADYYTEPPWNKISADTNVYILDYSYSREQTLKIKESSADLTVLDHHVSHQHELEGLDFAHFDMKRSGAGMTWDHFYPELDRPWLVDYVEDRDIWARALPQTDIVSSFIGTLPFEFSAWDEAENLSFAGVLMKGEAVQASIKRYIETVKQNAVMIEFEGYKVPFINAQKPFISELLNDLREGHPFAIGWHMSSSGFEYSLRSDGNVDVSKICALYRGGGHKAAAGFKLDSPLAHITQHRFKDSP